MKEAQFQTRFTRWFKKYGWTFAYELKVAEKRTLPFSKFQPQQLPSLRKAKHGIFHMKHTDLSIGIKPFDGQGMKKEDAFVGILFHKDDKKKREAWLIDIDLVYYLKNTGKKSISLEFCQVLGLPICKLFQGKGMRKTIN